MWFFSSPEVVFGENSLSHLDSISGYRALIVTDENMVRLGFTEMVNAHLKKANIESRIFAQVEPDPSLQTVKRGAEVALEYGPDWIIGLGGGSCLDAAKGVWVLYERPDMDPEAINPVEELGLGTKAHMIAIPTTSGTGSEATWAVVLTDTEAELKLSLGSREDQADIAIVDPCFVLDLPRWLVADTGMDALTHAIEGYTSTWRNDFSDGMALKAIQMVFDYLPLSWASGDAQAREKMHNAACMAGLAFGNSQAALAHALGHSLGATLHVPHGRAVGLFLPYTIEFTSGHDDGRYADIARFIGLQVGSEEDAGPVLSEHVRLLMERISQPTTLRELGIAADQFEAVLPAMVQKAGMDTSAVMSARIPDEDEMETLYRYSYEGMRIDF
jgi:alcohol dehydrogenase class IV